MLFVFLTQINVYLFRCGDLCWRNNYDRTYIK